MHTDNPLGSFIKQKLAELNLTQKELAERSGATQAVISRITSGEILNPRSDTLTKLAKGLGVSVDLIFEQLSPQLSPKKKKRNQGIVEALLLVLEELTGRSAKDILTDLLKDTMSDQNRD